MISISRTLILLVSSTAVLSAAVVTRGPYLQSAGTDRMTVCWRTDVATTEVLEFGLDPVSEMTTITKPGNNTDHEITITGLQPGTRYYYRLKGTPASGTAINVGGPQHWFRTAPSGAAPTRVWVVGDSGYPNHYATNAYNAYMARTAAEGASTDAFLMLGDNAYDIGSDSQYQNPVFERHAVLLRNTPIWSAFGNHDSYTSTQPNYTGPVPYDSIFRFPTGGECGGFPSGSERYYSFNHGNIHFISLDTNSFDISQDVPGGTYGMVDWLLDDLKACDKDWIIAIMHQGPYSKGSHNSDTEAELVRTRSHVIPLLENHGVDLVLCGHSHSYERSGFTDGHYGSSPTWNPATMRPWPGNGSEVGGVNPAGDFIQSSTMAGGAYQKPATIPRTGAVYAVAGGSSSVQFWQGGSSALVNPYPHSVHLVNLLAIGSLIVEVDGHRLHGRYIGETGLVRDDFTIVKGARYQLQSAVPAVVSGQPGVAFPVTRTEATAFAEVVPVNIQLISGSGVAPTSATAQFAPGQKSALVTFSGALGSRMEASLAMTTAAVQPGAAQRAKYSIVGGPRVGQVEATPSATWYASRFGTLPPSQVVWNTDADKDGLSLLLEYALGGEPDRNDSALLPVSETSGANFVMRYLRATGRTDLTYQVLASTDLGAWPPGPADVADGPPTALGEPRRAEFPISAGKGFLRLKVELQP